MILMEKKQYFEVKECFDGMKPGDVTAVMCDAHVIERMIYTHDDCEMSPAHGEESVYILKRKRANMRKAVYKACKEVGFITTEVRLAIRLTYLRNLVSDYNGENGTNIRVSHKGGRLFLSEDLNERESIKGWELEAVLRRVEAVAAMARRKVEIEDSDEA
jgi:hypothetical protein